MQGARTDVMVIGFVSFRQTSGLLGRDIMVILLFLTLSVSQPGLGVSQVKLHNTVKPSVDYVCQLKFPSGNYPPCIDDTRDLLVHWCHGAPGVIYMLLQAYKVPEILQISFGDS